MFSRPGGLLLEHTHQRTAGFEQGGADQQFQFLHQLPVGRLALAARHPFLDLLARGQEELSRRVFFLTPAARAARVWAITSAAYSAI